MNNSQLIFMCPYKASRNHGISSLRHRNNQPRNPEIKLSLMNTPNNYNKYMDSSIELSNSSLKLNLNNNNIINITNDNINFSSNVITNKIIYVK